MQNAKIAVLKISLKTQQKNLDLFHGLHSCFNHSSLWACYFRSV